MKYLGDPAPFGREDTGGDSLSQWTESKLAT